MSKGHVITHTPGFEGPPFDKLVNRLSGGLFVYTDASAVTLEVVGADGWMYLAVTDGDRRQIVRMFSDLTCDLAVSGAGGLHNDYVEAADTPYVIYAAWDSSTEPDEDPAIDPADLVLFAVPAGTAVTAALVASITRGGAYDFWSEPIGLAVNGAALNLIRFSMRGTVFFFESSDYGETVLAAGVELNWSKIDQSKFMPVTEAVGAYYFADAANTGAVNANVIRIGVHNGVAVVGRWHTPSLIAGAAGQVTEVTETLYVENIYFASPLMGMYYRCEGVSVTGGLTLGILGVHLY